MRGDTALETLAYGMLTQPPEEVTRLCTSRRGTRLARCCSLPHRSRLKRAGAIAEASNNGCGGNLG